MRALHVDHGANWTTTSVTSTSTLDESRHRIPQHPSEATSTIKVGQTGTPGSQHEREPVQQRVLVKYREDFVLRVGGTLQRGYLEDDSTRLQDNHCRLYCTGTTCHTVSNTKYFHCLNALTRIASRTTTAHQVRRRFVRRVRRGKGGRPTQPRADGQRHELYRDPG